MDNYGFLSLVPPLIAIILAIRTKQVFISLLTGIFVGWLIIGDWNLFKGILFTIDGIFYLNRYKTESEINKATKSRHCFLSTPQKHKT